MAQRKKLFVIGGGGLGMQVAQDLEKHKVGKNLFDVFVFDKKKCHLWCQPGFSRVASRCDVVWEVCRCHTSLATRGRLIARQKLKLRI